MGHSSGGAPVTGLPHTPQTKKRVIGGSPRSNAFSASSQSRW
jgi:hypothetical protein